jgi:hypothetical protein
VATGPCNICGPAAGGDFTIENPFVILLNYDPPDSMFVTCIEAQSAAIAADLTAQQCLILQLQATTNGRCGCPQDITLSPTTAPLTSNPTMEMGGEFCLICSDGAPPGRPAAFIGGITCAEADMRARNGEYDQEQCLMLQIREFLDDPCDCAQDTPGTLMGCVLMMT